MNLQLQMVVELGFPNDNSEHVRSRELIGMESVREYLLNDRWRRWRGAKKGSVSYQRISIMLSVDPKRSGRICGCKQLSLPVNPVKSDASRPSSSSEIRQIKPSCPVPHSPPLLLCSRSCPCGIQFPSISFGSRIRKIKKMKDTLRSGGWAVRDLPNHQVAIRFTSIGERNLELDYHWATTLKDHVDLSLQMEIRQFRSNNPFPLSLVISGAFLHKCLHCRISVCGASFDHDGALDSFGHWFIIHLKLGACDLEMLLGRMLLEDLCKKSHVYGSREEEA